jgi:hypothetical protein
MGVLACSWASGVFVFGAWGGGVEWVGGGEGRETVGLKGSWFGEVWLFGRGVWLGCRLGE